MSTRFFVALGCLLWAGSASAAVAIDVDGACPGALTVTITGVTPNKNVSLVSGKPGGTTALATGSCTGTTVDVKKGKVVSNGKADATGTRVVPLVGTAATCGSLIEAVDLTTCNTSPAVSMTPGCDTPDLSWIDAGPAAGPPYMADPAYFGISTEASVTSGTREDFEVEDAAGNIPVPATAIFTFYDSAGTAVCDIFYDISDAVLDPTYTSSVTVTTGAAVTVTEGVTATLAAGNSSCDAVNPAVWGTDDLRDLIDGDWSFGFNNVSTDLKNEVRTAVGAATYMTDYQPYLIGESVSGVEANFAATYDRTCEVVETDAATGDFVLLPKPAGAVVQEHAASTSVYIFGL